MIPGVVSYSVLNKEPSKKEHFSLITEFKKEEETVVWKDYVDLYQAKTQDFDLKFVKTDKGETQLLLKSMLPQFKPQLFNDHPHIKFISVIYNVYLIPDGDFATKFEKCGFGAIDEDKSVFKSTISKIGKTEINEPN